MYAEIKVRSSARDGKLSFVIRQTNFQDNRSSSSHQNMWVFTSARNELGMQIPPMVL